MLVAVQLSVLGLYLPPVLKSQVGTKSAPDDHFTAGPDRRVRAPGSGRVGGAGGCPTVRAGIVSPAGVKNAFPESRPAPDDHFRAGPNPRVTVSAEGALVVLVAVQLSVLGLYLPPVLIKCQVPCPPQTIISLPVQIAVCPSRASGALMVLVAPHWSVHGITRVGNFRQSVDNLP